MRTFGVVDQKLEEADYFCGKVAEAGANFYPGRYYFSAFVAAARSVTFAIQGSIKTLPGFDDWYSLWQDRLRKDRLARFFHECRTDSQHLGLCPLRSGVGAAGNGYLFFGQPEYGRYDWLPDLDVASACREQMRLICELVEDCYGRFSLEIDPDNIYTIDGLKAKGWSLEDVEEQLGFPRGWTDVACGDIAAKDAQRLNALRREIAMPGIWPIIRKYRDAPLSQSVLSDPTLRKLPEAMRNAAAEPRTNVMKSKVSFIRHVGEATEGNE